MTQIFTVLVAIAALCIATLSMVYRWRLGNKREAEAEAARALIRDHLSATLQIQEADVEAIVIHTERLAVEMTASTQRHSWVITQTAPKAAREMKARVKTNAEEWEQEDAEKLHELSVKIDRVSETIAGHFENRHIFLAAASTFSQSRAAKFQEELEPVFRQMPANAAIKEIADHSRQFGEQLSSQLHIPHHYQLQWQQSAEETQAAQNAACHSFTQGIKTAKAHMVASHALSVQANTPAVQALLRQYEAAVSNARTVLFQPDAALRRLASLRRQAGLNVPAAAGNVAHEDTTSFPNTLGREASVSSSTVACIALVPLAWTVMIPVGTDLALQVSWDAFTIVEEEVFEHLIQEIIEHIATWLAEELGINLTAEFVEGLLSMLTGIILIFKLGRYAYKAYKIFVEKEPLQKIRVKIQAFIQEKGETTSNTLAAYLSKQRKETTQTLTQHITTWKNEQEKEQCRIREAATDCSQKWCEQELNTFHALKRQATHELERWKNDAESRLHAWQWGWLRFFIAKPIA